MAEASHFVPLVVTETFPEIQTLPAFLKKDASLSTSKTYLDIEGPIDLHNISQKIVEATRKGLTAQNIQDIIANLPEQINLNELSANACNFLAYLCESAQVADLVKKLSFSISWENNSVASNFLLTQLVERGFGQNVLESLPDPLNLENLKVGRLLLILAQNGFKRQLIDRLPSSINLNLITDPGGIFLFLRFIFKEITQYEESKKEFFAKLVITVNLDELSEELGGFLAFLVSKGFGQNLVDKLPSKINLATISKGGNLLLNALCTEGFALEVLKKLPTLIDVENLPWGAGNFLISIANNPLNSLEIFMKLPKTITPHKCSQATGYILSHLVNNGFGEELFNKLSPSIDINALAEDMSYFLLSLAKMDKRFVSLIGQKIKLPIKIEALNTTADSLLAYLVEHGLSGIADNLTSPIDLASSDENKKYDTLNILTDLGYEKTLIDKLPDSIDINMLSIGSEEFLNSLIFLGYGEIVEDKILSSVSLASIEKPRARNLINDLFKAELGEKIKQKIQPQLPELEKSRQEMTISVNELPDEEVGPSLQQLIVGFPLDWQSKENIFGWSKYQVNKIGTASAAWIKFDPNDLEATRIIFLTANIEPESLAVYKKAIELMPTGVSRAFYPELTANARNKFYADGFREVFTGPRLSSLDLEKLPEKVTQSIQAQHQFILWTLIFNGIEHGHPHTDNFNVRFLLKDKQGNKKLFFDVNEALKTAVQDNQTITPIVTLRDWDEGKFRKKIINNDYI